MEVKFPIVGRTWITTNQEMAGRVLKDSATFTMRNDGGALAGMRGLMQQTHLTDSRWFASNPVVCSAEHPRP